MRTETGQPVQRLEDYRPTDYVVGTVEMTVRLDPRATRVATTLGCRRRDGASAEAPLILDGDGLRLVSIALDGAPVDAARFEASLDGLTVRDLPGTFSLTVETEIDPSANTKLMGLYRSRGTYCTQCEAEGFRRIAYMLDRPDVLAVYTVRIEAPGGEPVLLSNGDLVEEGDLDGGGRFAVWHDPHPKPAYLFALVAGDLGHIERGFTTMEGRDVQLRVYVEHGNEPEAAWAMDSLVRSMRWDEERWGRSYDLDRFNIVAVSDFNMGAMENKGLNVFNDKLVLASPETATDTDYARIEAVVAHEYFHNWTGNRITCRDWFQLCLKEGLTVYRDHEFQADMRDRDVRRIDEVRTLRAIQFPEDQGPLRHPVRPRSFVTIDNFYTATIYEKGSELVRMIAILLGREAFRAGMDLYFDRHDGEACTIEQFVACFEEAGDRSLAQFMRWYEQPGTPTLTVTTRRDGGDLVVDLAQSQPPAPDGTEPEPLEIPIAMELIDGDDDALEGTEGAVVCRPDGRPVIVLTAKDGSVRVPGMAGATAVPLVGFSAPVVLRREGEAIGEERLRIAAAASDPFSRWDALNATMLDVLARAGAGNEPAFEDAVDALGRTVGDGSLSPAFRAAVLAPPSEGEIARAIGRDVDPDHVHAARTAFLRMVAERQVDALRAIHDDDDPGDPYRPDAAQSGRRALRNAALSTLATVEGPGRAADQFDAAGNMTDRMAALSTLTARHPGTAEAERALDAFAARFGDRPLVMDKWFTAQAQAPGPETLDRVVALEGHPAYDANNPNRVRALWGTLAGANPTAFNRADGRGFAVLAERLASFDRHNPQLAARLANAFREHPKLEINRREKARNALKSLAENHGLSRDLRDIVGRTLAS